MRALEATFYFLDRATVAMDASYNVAFLQMFKALVPAKHRQWRASDKIWAFTPSYISEVIDLATRMGYEIETTPYMGNDTAQQEVETIIAQVNYLGNARRRPDGSVNATGLDERGEWVYLFPFDVLAEFLDISIVSSPLTAKTHYERLGVERTATGDEIKRAFRKAVRAWHPDVNAHPDAAEATIAIRDSYEVLANERQRRKYDVALKLAPQVDGGNAVANEIVWVPPDYLRCGLWKVDVTHALGRMAVEKIHDHYDIVNSAGEIMAVRWDGGNGTPLISWT
jgi:hypothetical protein